MSFFLKLLYTTKIGRSFRPIFTFRIASRLAGYFADCSVSRIFVRSFIKRHKIDMSEFDVSGSGYRTFNDFFYRKLKPGIRVIDMNQDHVISPADGYVFVVQNLDYGSTFFVKNCNFDLKKFLKDEELASEYKNGILMLFRLSPSDYHRFHFPLDCTPTFPKTIHGSYESVNPVAYNSINLPLTENERHLITLTSEKFGKVLFVEVGAMLVGKIHETFQPNKQYKKGDEMGYFAFGASSLVMIFKQHVVEVSDNILQNSKIKIETPIKMGTVVAKFAK